MIKELARQNAEHRELLVQIAESWKSDFARHRGEASATIYEPSGDQVPGGCLCRATTYTFSKAPQNPPEDFNWEANYVVPGGKDGNNKWAASHCYCDSCRVSVGTLVATWFSVPRSQFRLRRKGSTTVYRSSSHATREFVSSPMLPFRVSLNLLLASVQRAEHPCSSTTQMSQNSSTLHWRRCLSMTYRNTSRSRRISGWGMPKSKH